MFRAKQLEYREKIFAYHHGTAKGSKKPLRSNFTPHKKETIQESLKRLHKPNPLYERTAEEIEEHMITARSQIDKIDQSGKKPC